MCIRDRYYLAEALCDTVLNSEYTVLERCTGKDLEFKEYEPLFDFCLLYTSRCV